MHKLLNDFQGTLQLLQPSLHEVDVLEHDPSTLLCHLREVVERNCLLALAHGDVQEAAVGLRDAQFFAQRLHRRRGVHAGEQNEEIGADRSRLLVRYLHVEGRLLNVVLTQVVDDKLSECSSNAILPHNAEEEEAVEGCEVPGTAWKVRELRFLLREPTPPSERVLLNVLGQLASLLEGLQPLESLQLAPLRLGEPCPRVLGHGRRVGVWRRTDEHISFFWTDLAGALQDLHGDHGNHCQLVCVQQASSSVVPDKKRDDVPEQLNPLLQLLASQFDDLLLFLHWLCDLFFFLLLVLVVLITFFCFDFLLGLLLGHLLGLPQGHAVDGPSDDRNEGVQGVLVEGVHLTEVHEQEEQQGTASPDRPVELGRLVDFDLRVLRNDHLLLHLVRCDLCLLQAQYQLCVVQDVALRIGQLLKQQCLQVRQRHLELVLLLDELGLLPGQVGPLQLYHQEQELILQAVLGYGEVDDGALCLYLWRVVGVRQLRLHEELEVGGEDDLLVPKLYHALVAALDGVPRHHGLKHGINGLGHVLDEHGLPVVQGHLEGAQHLAVAHAGDLEPIVCLLVLDPHDALQLRVDDQVPSLGVQSDGAVLAGHAVRWQALSSPRGLLCFGGQDAQRVRLGPQGHALLGEEGDELSDAGLAVVSREDANVGGKRAGDEGVAWDVDQLLGSVLYGLLPDNAIRCQCIDEPLCHVQLRLALLSLRYHRVLLANGLIELGHQLCQLGLEVSDQCFHLSQPRVRVVQRISCITQRLTFRLHLNDHIIVHDDVDDEDAETSRRAGLLLHALECEVVAHGDLDLPGFLNVYLWDLSLVNGKLVILQVLQELLRIVHHLCSTFPRAVLDASLLVNVDVGVDACLQVHGSLAHQVDTAWRLRQSLQLLEVLFIEHVQRRLCLLHQRDGLGQVLRAGHLLDCDVRGDLRALLRLHCRLV
mmetsp:Transcript_30652/g.69674  ORF Transcript_30652/g.69674 Transcript_30652/m.69674 type:complete len:931 (-) Transcript_30652:423-3215(-)